MTQDARQNEKTAGPLSVDIAIVGAGVGGTCTASNLADAGYSVALVDTQAVYPPEFRAEKLAGAYLDYFRKLGVGTAALKAVTPYDDILTYRFGKLVVREDRREYGFAYSALVNSLRDGLPSSVHRVIGRVGEVRTSPERQVLTLNDGRTVDARLLVISTGLGDAVRRAAGIRREETHRTHSLSLGFTLDRPASDYPFGSLNYFGFRREDRMAYLTLFPIGNIMRANLFVYREPGEEWTKRFRKEPQRMLAELAPEIVDDCLGFGLAGPVEVRPIDLLVTHDYRRDGVVLIGDAFRTTCPVPGVGLHRVLNDADRLCTVHVPRWMATGGMARAKIEEFYDDPVKQEVDAKGVAASLYARSLLTGEGLWWSLRRLRNNTVRKTLYAALDVARKLHLHENELAPPPVRARG